MHTSNRPEAGNQWGRWGSLSVIGPLSSKPLHVPNLPETASSSGGGGGGGRFKPSFMAAWLAACDEWDALSLSLSLSLSVELLCPSFDDIQISTTTIAYSKNPKHGPIDLPL